MTPSTPNVTQAVPFFWVRDIEASIKFYTEGLGFVLTNAWIDDGKRRWCWLELGGAAVMLQEFWMDGPHRNIPDSALGVGVGIYFTCREAIAIYHELKGRGLTPQRPFVGNGMWVTHIADPDGYALYFESKTKAPEESELGQD